VVAAFDAQAEATETAALDPSLDLDATLAPPQGPPWYTGEPVSARWVLFHLVEEVARHAGHADIIREQLDGATAAALLATVEEWPETAGVTPWRAPET
jgi:mono/diheme cytochrome c family protein